MPDEILIRQATLADVATVARQRAAMFVDMGSATAAIAGQLQSETEAFLRQAIPSGEYIGWLASLASRPHDAVAGAGVQVRCVLPFPLRWADGRVEVAQGRQAIVLNVYTEPAFRRRGLARRLMQEVLAWARTARIESLVLHAAPDGRPLYEQLGFAPTNEMRFMGDRSPSCGA
jgi:GNAT superfamily N-acetyltransferase